MSLRAKSRRILASAARLVVNLPVEFRARRIAPVFEMQPLEKRLYFTANPTIAPDPSMTTNGDGSINEGAPYVIDLAANADASTTINQWIVRWGDGNTS